MRSDKVLLTIDSILPYVGEYGRYQKLLDFLLFIIVIPISAQNLIMYFSTIAPSWRCKNNSDVCMYNGTFPSEDVRRCSISRAEWYYTEPKEFSLVTQFDVHCDDKWLLQLATSMFFVGGIFGSIVFGWLGDRYGRKVILFPAVAIILTTGFTSSFLPNMELIIACRFIIGFFFTGAWIQVFVLISEIVGNKHRALASLITCLGFPVGFSIIALKAYLLQNWKLLMIASTAPYVFTLMFYAFVPESVRWLHLQGHEEEAMEIFHTIACWNKKKLPENIVLTIPAVKPARKSNLLNVFRSRKLACQTSIHIYLWLISAMGFYGLTLAANDLEGSIYRDFFLLSIVEVPGLVLAVVASDRFGRKKTSLITMCLGGLSCVGVAFIPVVGELKIARVVLGLLGKALSSTEYNCLYIWSAEYFPTDIRSAGMGFLQVMARVGSSIAPWVIKGLKPFAVWIPFGILGLTAVIGSILGLYLPETKGMVLKESNYANENGVEDLPAEVTTTIEMQPIEYGA